MGKCLSKTKDDQKRRNVTLAIFGIDNAGKTSLLKVLQGVPYEGGAPTVGFSTNQLKWKKYNVTLYDVGGGVRIRDIWKNYFAETHGIIFVVDAGDDRCLDESKMELTKTLRDPRIHGKPILLLLNKQDVPGALADAAATEKMQLEPLVNEFRCPCRVEGVSATRGSGKRMDPSLREGFNWLLKYIDENYSNLGEKIARDTEAQRAQLARENEERTERIKRTRAEREAEEAEQNKDQNPAQAQTSEVQKEEFMVPATLNGNPFANVKNVKEQDEEQSDKNHFSLQEKPSQIPNGHLPLPPVRQESNAGKEKNHLETTSTSLFASVKNSGAASQLPPISPPQMQRHLQQQQSLGKNGAENAVLNVPRWQTTLSVLEPPKTDETQVENGQEPKANDELSEGSDHAARRKRRKRRLQRFNNRTAPGESVEKSIDRIVQVESQPSSSAGPHVPVLPPQKPHLQNPSVNSLDMSKSTEFLVENTGEA